MKNNVRKGGTLSLIFFSLFLLMSTTALAEDGLKSLKETISQENKLINSKIIFNGTVGSHDVLSYFGDVEGEGLLEATTRDTGQVRLFKFDSKSTSDNQMAMNVGRSYESINKVYPNDLTDVLSLVYSGAISPTMGLSGERGATDGIYMDNASVGVLSNNERTLTHANLNGRNIRYGNPGTVITTQRSTGLHLAQSSTLEEENILLGNEESWVFHAKNPSGNGTTGGEIPKNISVMLKMYNSSEKPYVVAYGAHVERIKVSPYDYELLGYVRMIMQPVNEEGRVRINYSYVNLTDDDERNYSALYASYGSKLSSTNSIGDNKGEFFQTGYQVGKGLYAHAIYRDNYPKISDKVDVHPPVGRVVKNSSTTVSATHKIDNSFFPGVTPPDPGTSKPFTEKSLGYVWEKQATRKGSIASWDLDIQGFSTNQLIVRYYNIKDKTNIASREVSTALYGNSYTTKPKEIKGYRVIEPYPENYQGTFSGKDVFVDYMYEVPPVNGKVVSRFVDTEGKEILSENEYVAKIGSKFELQQKEIKDYIYLKTEGATSGNVTEETQNVTYTYQNKEKAFKLEQQVFDEQGVSADKVEVKQGKKLTYQLKIKASSELANLEYIYEDVTVIEKLDSNLESLEEIKFSDFDGNYLGEAYFDSNTNQIIATTSKNSLSTKKDLILTFTAAIKKGAKVGDIIRQKAEMKTTIFLEENLQTINSIKSNEVQTKIASGTLDIVSLPSVLNFGENIKISDKDQTYKVIRNLENQLIIQDNRPPGEKWSIGLAISKEMTSESGDTLLEVLYYKDINDDILVNTSVQIVKETISSDDSLINISDEWNIDRGLRLKVKSGTARAQKYQGMLNWTLNDVP